MDPIQALLIGVIAPGAAALALGLSARGRPWGAPLALAAGYALAFGLILGWPGLPPVDVTRVSPWVALALAPLGLMARGRGLATGVVGLATGLFLGAPLYKDEPALLLGVSALIALTFVALERGLDRALAKTDPRGGALALTVLASGAAAAVLFSDTAALAQVTGGLAAASGALFALALLFPARLDLKRAAPVFAGIVATNLWSAGLYANGRYEVIALIALAPLAMVSLAPSARTLWAIIRPALLVALPVTLAAVLAGARYFAEPVPTPTDTTETQDPDYGY